jgi:hypothetical protein
MRPVAFIKLGKAMQERLYRKIQSQLPLGGTRLYVFTTLNEMREQTEKWPWKYNEDRPHEAPAHMTPREYC